MCTIWTIIATSLYLLCATKSANLPQTCQDYANYNSTHGSDKTNSPKIMFPVNDNHLQNEDTLYGKSIKCNQTDSDICIITCDTSEFCAFATIEPDPDSKLKELHLLCSARKACQHVQANIEHTAIDTINILCGPSLSCDEVSISINNINETFLSLQCDSSLSCNDISIDLTNQNIHANISCYNSYSCDNMNININSRNIFTQLYMFQYSENILISQSHSNNIDIICGSLNDYLYIEYPIDDLLDESELLKLAQNKYYSRNLPCADITIDCSQNQTYFDFEPPECHYEYELLPINVSRHNNITGHCLWIEINDLYQPNCIGTCYNNNIIFYHQYNITFELDIIISFNEQMSRSDTYGKFASQSYDSSDERYLSNTQSYEACQKYFGTENTTQVSLQEIDTAFFDVLKIVQKDHRTLIHSILIPPQTILNYDNNNIGFVTCANEQTNIIEIKTDVSIQSSKDNKHAINKIFSEDSQFIATSTQLFKTMFNAPITLSVHHSEINDGVGKKWIAVVIFFGLLCIGLILGIIYRKRQQYLKRRELKTIYISNAKVICICIGFYDDNPKQPDINLNLSDLDGVRVDISNIIQLFVQTLNYDLFPNYFNDNINTYKADWTYKEIISFLKQEADSLEKNLIENDDPYDGLVVTVSCHGMKDNIITSDHKMVSKTTIHRIFSSKKPKIRQIPRLFIFDCCSGSNEREDDFREDNINDQGKGKSILDDDDDVDIIYDDEKHVDDDVIWARDEDNPDFKLVRVSAANEGFQSKMDFNTGSYVITAFTQKMIANITENNNYKNLRKIFDAIQEELHANGKQLMESVYNNKTGNIKFVVKGSDQDLTSQSIISRLGSVGFSRLNSSGVSSEDERRKLIKN